MEDRLETDLRARKIQSQHRASGRDSEVDPIDRNNRTKAIEFKAAHGLLILFFLWILFVIAKMLSGLY